MTADIFGSLSDQLLVWGMNMLVQVSLITIVSLVVAFLVRRTPALRYGVLCSAMVLVLLCPTMAFVLQFADASLLTVSLQGDSLVGQARAEREAGAELVGDIGRPTSFADSSMPMDSFLGRQRLTSLWVGRADKQSREIESIHGEASEAAPLIDPEWGQYSGTSGERAATTPVSPDVIGIEDILTDNDGRFRIENIGEDRVVRLFAAGPKVARSFYWMISRETKPLKTRFHTEKEGFVYGSKADPIVVSPSRPIQGVVRDADTGDPMAGVSIESYQFAGSNMMGNRQYLLRTATDDDGRFRLDGMPKRSGNTLLVVPGEDLPYFVREIPVPVKVGFDVINVEVELHRGIWIEGEVVDNVTGEPVQAMLTYLPFMDNPTAAKLPEFTTIGSGYIDGGVGRQMPWVTRPDGTFRLVGFC